MANRIYIGRLSGRASERDIEKFFKGFGKIRFISLKNGYGFVDLEDERDADDAVYELHGRELLGERVIVEYAKGPTKRSSSFRDGPPPKYSRGGPRPSWLEKYGAPIRTGYKLIVENLSSRVSWQDLKDYMRQAGDVTFADAHKEEKNVGVVEFATYFDMKKAIEKLDGTEINGRKIKLIEDANNRSASRSHSRNGSPRRRNNRSHSRSRSRGRRDSSSNARRRRHSSGSGDRSERRNRRSASRDGSGRRDRRKRSGSNDASSLRRRRSRSVRSDESRSKGRKDRSFSGGPKNEKNSRSRARSNDSRDGKNVRNKSGSVRRNKSGSVRRNKSGSVRRNDSDGERRSRSSSRENRNKSRKRSTSSSRASSSRNNKRSKNRSYSRSSGSDRD